MLSKGAQEMNRLAQIAEEILEEDNVYNFPQEVYDFADTHIDQFVEFGNAVCDIPFENDPNADENERPSLEISTHEACRYAFQNLWDNGCHTLQQVIDYMTREDYL
jgi:hypothetical protein